MMKPVVSDRVLERIIDSTKKSVLKLPAQTKFWTHFIKYTW